MGCPQGTGPTSSRISPRREARQLSGRRVLHRLGANPLGPGHDGGSGEGSCPKFTVVRAMSISSSTPMTGHPSSGSWETSVPARMTCEARGCRPCPLLVSMSVNIIANCCPIVGPPFAA